MSRYALRVWCRDCGGLQDPQGCFDGRSELLEKRYATVEEAEEARRERQESEVNPWQYDIEEIEGLTEEERLSLLREVDPGVSFLPSDPGTAFLLGMRRGEQWMSAGHDYHAGVRDGVREAFKILGQEADERAMVCRRVLALGHPPCRHLPWLEKKD